MIQVDLVPRHAPSLPQSVVREDVIVIRAPQAEMEAGNRCVCISMARLAGGGAHPRGDGMFHGHTSWLESYRVLSP